MNKNIMALILTVLTAFTASPIVDEITDSTPAPEIAIDAPDACEVGELVRLTYAARKVEWRFPNLDYEVSANPQHAVISFRDPGVYTIIVGGLVDSDVRLVEHSIRVKERGSVLVPTPLPDNVPDVDVDTGDVPVIVPFPSPDKPSFDLRNKVNEWCREQDVPSNVAKALGENFIEAATNTTTTADLMRSVAEKNRTTDQSGAEGVLVKIQVWMIENLTGSDFINHQCAISEIGTGLLDYSEEN